MDAPIPPKNPKSETPWLRIIFVVLLHDLVLFAGLIALMSVVVLSVGNAAKAYENSPLEAFVSDIHASLPDWMKEDQGEGHVP